MSRSVWFVALVVLLLGCQSAVAHANSFVWQVTDDNNTVYLAGSIHLLPPDAYPLPQPFSKAFEDAEIVAFETNIKRLRSSEVQTRLFQAARYDHGGLASRLDDELYARVSEVLGDMGLSVTMVRAFKPWFVASMIELSAFQTAGFKQKLGVDAHFYDKARKQGKKILALEPVDWHIQLLTKMPLEMQLNYLRTTVENIEALEDAPSVVYDYWRKGDAAGLAQYIQTQIKAAPALFKRLLFERNKRWMQDIVHLIEGSKDAMVIVGALHLVGERGLIQQLEQRGYEVERT